MTPRVRRGLPLPRVAAITLPLVLPALRRPGFADAARAFQVNDTNDRVDANLGDGLCRTSQNTCTLRAAIQQANMLNGADEINLPGGVYTIRLGGGAVVDPPDPPGGVVGFVWDPGLFQDYEGDYDIGGPLTINGAGDASTIIDGGAPAFGSTPEQTALDRIFEIHPNAGNVTLSGVTIREGWHAETGGGLMNYSAGVVRLVDSTVRDNAAWNYGGGIYSGGPQDGLCVNTCPVGDGRLEIVRTNLIGNRTEGKGGGVFSTMSSTAVIGSATKKSIFRGNHADEGAAIYNGGELSPTGSRARVEVSHGQFDENLARAGGEGGAVKTHGERPVSITDSNFIENEAGVDLIDELGEFHEGEGGGGGMFGDGAGGIVNQGSDEFVVEDSTIMRNTAFDGGGVTNRPDALSRFVNVTLWDNRA